MQKIVRPVSLAAEALPPALEPCFDLMEQAGEGAPFALFGGALRDARYWNMHGMPRGIINDYDIRMIAPHEQVEELAQRLGVLANKTVRIESSLGTGLPLYRIADYYGADLDISFRPAAPELDPDIIVQAPTEAAFSASTTIAQERAVNAVVGISGIAMDFDRTIWETPEHAADCEQRTLSVYPRTIYPYPSFSRVSEYVEHMQAKFPDHTTHYLPTNEG